jgi:hypothetical protein
MALVTNLQQNPSPPHSVTVQGAYEPFDLQVSRSQIMGHNNIQLFGYSAVVGSTALGPLWEGLTTSGGAYVYPSSALQMTLVSGNAADTQIVQIQGLYAKYNLLSEYVTLNGTTGVVSVNSYLRINGLYITNGVNAGTITCKNSTNLYAQINAGVGQTQMSIYTVPNGYTFYLTYVQADSGIGFTSSNYMIFAEYNKFNLSVTNNNINGYLVNYGGNTTLLNQSPYVQSLNIPYTVALAHSGGTDIQFQVKANTGSPFTAGIFASGYLIKNDGQTA